MQNQNYAAPGVLVVAANPARAIAAVEACGARLLDRVGLAEATEAIAARAAIDAVLVDLVEGDAFDDALVSAAPHGLVVNVPLNLLDDAWAVAPAAVHLLCDADEAALALALADALAIPLGAHVAEGSDHAVELRRLSEEVGRVARALEALAAESAAPPATVALPSAVILRATLRARRLRERYFPRALFADPAWDMLLDLTAAHVEGQPVSVSSLCLAAAVPPTTALRWITALERTGMFVRIADPSDRRRVFLALSEQTIGEMAGYFAAVDAQGLPRI